MYNVLAYLDEKYVFITDSMIKNIWPNKYSISNYGTVFDNERNTQVSQCFCGDGYLRVSLKLINSEFRVRQFLVHRLVGFAFIPGDWSLQINHKDGIKINNYYKNLEWVTPHDNLIHAINNGLNYRGEDKPNAILTNELVNEICKLLQSGLDYNEIVNTLNLNNINNIHEIMHDIKCGKSWKFISDMYNIPKYKIVNNRMLSKEQVNAICIALDADINISNTNLFNIAGIDVSTPEKYNKMRHCIESIKQGKAYRDISDNYNFRKGSTTIEKVTE